MRDDFDKINPRPSLARARSNLSESDHVVFSVFYKDHIKPLIKFLNWIGAPGPQAAEIAFDTMAHAWWNWSSIDHPRRWIYSYAENEYFRRLERTDHPDEELVAELPLRSPIVAEGADIRAWMQRYDESTTLAALPPSQRDVLSLFLQDYTPLEIARLLGISPEAARARLKRARKSFAARHDDTGGLR